VRLTLVRDRLTWLTYGQLAIFGYFIYGFGPVVPLLRDEQGTSRAVASLHGTALALGGILGGAALPWLVRRYGRRAVIGLGQVGMAAGLLGFLGAHTLPATLACTLVATTGGSLIINGVTAVLAEHHGAAGPAAISEANALAAGVGTASPLIVGASFAVGWGWRPGLVALVGAIAGLAVVAHFVTQRAPDGPVALADPAPRRPLPRLYWLAWTSLVATGSVEVCLNLWAADVLRERAAVAPGAASAAMAGIVAGMFAGRVVGARLLLRLSAPRVLLGSLAFSAAGFTLFWLASVPWLAIVGLVTCGLGNAMHFPLGMGLALGHSGGQPDLAASRTAYAMGVGFGLAPFALGALADRVGPHPAFLMVYGFLAVSAGAVLRLSALTREREPVGDRQHDRFDAGVGEDRLVERHDRPVVGGLGSEDATAA
jgi:MFS family permease